MPIYRGTPRLKLFRPGSIALPGPPTFAYVSSVTATNSASTTIYSLSLGGAVGTDKFVAVIIEGVGAGGTVALVSAAFTSPSASATAITIANGANYVHLITGTIPGSNTTATLTVTWNIGTSGINRGNTYVCTDVTQMLSTSPAVTPTFTTINSGTSISNSITFPNSGSAVLYGFTGGLNGGNSVTASNPTTTNDATFNVTLTGHAFNAAAGTASMTVSFASAVSGTNLAQVVFR